MTCNSTRDFDRKSLTRGNQFAGALAALALAFGSAAHAQQPIGIQFVGNGTAMGSAEVAGVTAQSNWNPASGTSSGAPLVLMDGTGASSGATVTWNSNGMYAEPISNTPGNNRLMLGYLDTVASVTTVTVAGLPASAGGYNVYVYAEGANGGGTRTGAYQISGSGITTTSVNLSQVGSSDFTGSFTQASNSAGNYVVFSISAAATGFTITATPGATTDVARAPVNAIQVVPVSANNNSPAAIGIQFVGNGTAMGSAEVAGVVAQSNWNPETGVNSAGLLQNQNGVSSGATVSWSTNGIWSEPISNTPGNNRLMLGYLDTVGGATTVSVAGLPSNAGGYNVYVYAEGANGGGTRTGAYQISGSGITTTSVNLSQVGSTDFTGSFTQANNSAGNYVVFPISSAATGFTITATPGATTDIPRAPLNAIQIVPASNSGTSSTSGSGTSGSSTSGGNTSGSGTSGSSTSGGSTSGSGTTGSSTSGSGTTGSSTSGSGTSGSNTSGSGTIQYPRLSHNLQSPNNAAGNVQLAQHLDVAVLTDDFEGAAGDAGYNRGTLVNQMIAGDGVVVPKVMQYVLDSYYNSSIGSGSPSWDAQMQAMANYWFLYDPPNGHVYTRDGPGDWAYNPADQGPAGEDANGNNVEAAFAKFVNGEFHTGSTSNAAANLSGPWKDNFTSSGWYFTSGGNWLGGGPYGGTVVNNNDVTAMIAARAGEARFYTWYRANQPGQFLMGNTNVLGDLSDDPGVPIWQRPPSVNTSLYGLLDAGMVESAFGPVSTEHYQGFEQARMLIQYVDGMVRHPEFNQYVHYGINSYGEDSDLNASVGQAVRYSICAVLIIANGTHAPNGAAGTPWYDYYAVNPNTGVALDYATATTSQIGAARRWLGTPIDGIQTAPTQEKVYARRFLMPNGRTALVLVNPSANGGNWRAAPQTINLTAAFGGNWTHVLASGGTNVGTNSSVDNGATVSSVTVPVGDGMILIQ